MERDLIEVINKMIQHIPCEETELKETLEKIKYDVTFQAPELRHLSWHRVSHVLQDYVLPISEDWKVKICSVFSTLSEEEIRRENELLNK